LVNKFDNSVKIRLVNHLSNEVLLNFDNEQFNRLFFNLIKNSVESIQEKVKKDNKTVKNIDIEIRQRRDNININIVDTGTGFKNKKTKDIIKPYFTTKEKGTGLGLSIVDKIISDHEGSIKFLNHKNGAKIQIKSPPPIESIALGALAKTPGVKIKDILNKGLSIRLFNKREQKHFWHPIFCKGQTWPTETPFKLILQASKNNQKIFEVIIGESQKERIYDVIFENGLPKLSEIQKEEEIITWDKKPLKIVLKNKSNIGEDNLVLFFKINTKANLLVKYFDIKDEFLGEYNLGNIF